MKKSATQRGFSAYRLWALLPRLEGIVSRLAILYADSGYAGPMVEAACQALAGCRLVTIAKDAAAHGFHVLPKRWVVERTLAWLCRNRRAPRTCRWSGS